MPFPSSETLSSNLSFSPFQTESVGKGSMTSFTHSAVSRVRLPFVRFCAIYSGVLWCHGRTVLLSSGSITVVLACTSILQITVGWCYRSVAFSTGFLE